MARLLALAACARALTVELEMDGALAPLRFRPRDDLRAVAEAWSARHPAAGGMDCADGHRGCVVDVLVGAGEKVTCSSKVTERFWKASKSSIQLKSGAACRVPRRAAEGRRDAVSARAPRRRC